MADRVLVLPITQRSPRCQDNIRWLIDFGGPQLGRESFEFSENGAPTGCVTERAGQVAAARNGWRTPLVGVPVGRNVGGDPADAPDPVAVRHLGARKNSMTSGNALLA
jgi:hypothetical protein